MFREDRSARRRKRTCHWDRIGAGTSTLAERIGLELSLRVLCVPVLFAGWVISRMKSEPRPFDRHDGAGTRKFNCLCEPNRDGRLRHPRHVESFNYSWFFQRSPDLRQTLGHALRKESKVLSVGSTDLWTLERFL